MEHSPTSYQEAPHIADTVEEQSVKSLVLLDGN